jgi:large subunit ribosomal protein L3
LEVIPQEIVRYKNQEKDWYVAAIIWTWKKELNKEKWQKIKYKTLTEFKVDDSFVSSNEAGKIIDVDFLSWVEKVNITGESKWKWFQGMVKRFHIKGGWATHGHKFTRTWGSKWNRKPRRTLKWHPHAWHMWAETITLKNLSLIEVVKNDKEQLIILKWSIPGSRNSLLKLTIA